MQYVQARDTTANLYIKSHYIELMLLAGAEELETYPPAWVNVTRSYSAGKSAGNWTLSLPTL